MYIYCKHVYFWACFVAVFVCEMNDITVFPHALTHRCSLLLWLLAVGYRVRMALSSAANQWRRFRARARLCKKPQHSRNSQRRRAGRVMVRDASIVSALFTLALSRHKQTAVLGDFTTDAMVLLGRKMLWCILSETIWKIRFGLYIKIHFIISFYSHLVKPHIYLLIHPLHKWNKCLSVQPSHDNDVNLS